jgi:hypothetical protein
MRGRALVGAVQLNGGTSWPSPNASPTAFFEPMSKRRKGFPSETRVKRGYRVVRGQKELIRETGPQRLMPLRQPEVVSGIAA